MSNKNILIGVFSVTAIMILIIVLVKEKEKNKQLAARVKSVEGNNMKLILESIQDNETLTDEVQKQLKELVNRFQHIDKRVTDQIEKALALFQVGQIPTAIMSLVTIIEKMLKVHYEENQTNASKVKAWVKNVKEENQHRKKNGKKTLEVPNSNTFRGLLRYCAEVDNKITKEEFKYITMIKEMRNAESHELGVKFPGWVGEVGMTTAINGIAKIAEFVYPVKNVPI